MNRAERRAAQRAAKGAPVDTAEPTPLPTGQPQVVAVHGIVVNVVQLSNGTANAGVAAVYGQMQPLGVVKALQAAAAGIAQQMGGAKLVGADGAPII